MAVRRQVDARDASGEEHREQSNTNASDRARQPASPKDERRKPWRVEGSRETGRPGEPPPRQGLRWLWWVFALMLLLNWVVASNLSTTTATTLNIAYSIFRTQVDHRNVASVTATGETIVGTFRQSVSYPLVLRLHHRRSTRGEARGGMRRRPPARMDAGGRRTDMQHVWLRRASRT